VPQTGYKATIVGFVVVNDLPLLCNKGLNALIRAKKQLGATNQTIFFLIGRTHFDENNESARYGENVAFVIRFVVAIGFG
jgi:hypothetical protein